MAPCGVFGLNETNERLRLLETVNISPASRKGSVVVPQNTDSVVADRQLRRRVQQRTNDLFPLKTDLYLKGKILV